MLRSVVRRQRERFRGMRRRRRRMRSRHLLVTAGVMAALALASALAALSGFTGTDAAAHLLAGGVPDHITIRLRAVDDSGVSGKATLRADDGVTSVAIRITAPDGTYPAHIHDGTCDDFAAMPALPLADADEEQITRTIVDVPLADLLAGGYVINLHRPTVDLVTMLDPASVVACGAIAIERSADGEPVTEPPVTGVGSAIAGASIGGVSIGMTLLAIVLASAGIAVRRSERRSSPRFAT